MELHRRARRSDQACGRQIIVPGADRRAAWSEAAVVRSSISPPAGRLDELPELIRELVDHVAELSARDCFAHRRQNGTDVVVHLGRAKTGPLCDPLLEVLQAEGLATVAGAQGLLQRLRKLSCKVGRLPSAQSFRQRLEGGPRDDLGASLINPGTLSDGMDELVVIDGFRLPAAARTKPTWCDPGGGHVHPAAAPTATTR
jgi:hypothetical protein